VLFDFLQLLDLQRECDAYKQELGILTDRPAGSPDGSQADNPSKAFFGGRHQSSSSPSRGHHLPTLARDDSASALAALRDGARGRTGMGSGMSGSTSMHRSSSKSLSLDVSKTNLLVASRTPSGGDSQLPPSGASNSNLNSNRRNTPSPSPYAANLILPLMSPAAHAVSTPTTSAQQLNALRRQLSDMTDELTATKERADAYAIDSVQLHKLKSELSIAVSERDKARIEVLQLQSQLQQQQGGSTSSSSASSPGSNRSTSTVTQVDNVKLKQLIDQAGEYRAKSALLETEGQTLLVLVGRASKRAEASEIALRAEQDKTGQLLTRINDVLRERQAKDKLSQMCQTAISVCETRVVNMTQELARLRDDERDNEVTVTACEACISALERYARALTWKLTGTHHIVCYYVISVVLTGRWCLTGFFTCCLSAAAQLQVPAFPPDLMETVEKYVTIFDAAAREGQEGHDIDSDDTNSGAHTRARETNDHSDIQHAKVASSEGNTAAQHPDDKSQATQHKPVKALQEPAVVVAPEHARYDTAAKPQLSTALETPAPTAASRTTPPVAVVDSPASVVTMGEFHTPKPPTRSIAATAATGTVQTGVSAAASGITSGASHRELKDTGLVFGSAISSSIAFKSDSGSTDKEFRSDASLDDVMTGHAVALTQPQVREGGLNRRDRSHSDADSADSSPVKDSAQQPSAVDFDRDLGYF
jgi:hypothetical protein